MTIPEAARLVLQAAAIGDSGQVLVLDMGEPVKIVDLARDMIRLAGRSEAEIGITFTKLRPGEKLHEELLIGNDPKSTSHPRIMSATERRQPPDDLTSALVAAEAAGAIAKHAASKKWSRPLFEFYLNGKVYFKHH